MKIVIPIILLLTMMFSCNSKKNSDTVEKKWWKEIVFYEIYMPSYKDSNSDGYGDFKGLTSKLNYLQDLGIKGVWLTPFLKSPMVDNGYDVSSYTEINDIYGMIKDFKTFINEAHKRGIKVIMDMVVNHTSTEHKWFKESRKSIDNPYRNYYIWKDAPNNWESFFGGTAWEFDSITSQYYYHQFDVKMADLNWGNTKVVEEIQNVLRFWLDLGIDGFRLDVINFLTTDGITQDNPMIDGEQIHRFDKDQSGVKNAMRVIKSTVDEYDNRFIVGEIGSDKIDELKQYQASDLLDVVFNFNFGSIKTFSAQRIYDELQSMEINMNNYPTLFFGSHDMPRFINRLANNNLERAETLAALMLTAKGVPFIYYGEEIGMKNHVANSFNDIKDIQGITHYKLAINNGKSDVEALQIANEHNRDKSRSPMQWNSDTLSGFSSTTSWLGINPDYLTLNAVVQEKNIVSMLTKYRQLIALRNSEPVLQYGNYEKLSFSNDCISFIRIYNKERIKCFFNFSKNPIEIALDSKEKVLLGKTTIRPNNYLIVKFLP